jgi:arylsulfatase A-like enzyme
MTTKKIVMYNGIKKYLFSDILFGGILSVFLMVLLLSFLGCTTKQSNHSNLIVVLLDTLRVDHLGYYGYKRNTSPNLDKFAEKSTVFLEHYSHSSRTGPSVATLFTGLYPKSHGVINPLSHWDAKGTLTESQTTLAEILKSKGYVTAGFNSNPNIVSRFGFNQGFDVYKTFFGKVPMDISTPLITDEAIKFLTNQQDNQPFFLYLHYMDTHSPYYTHNTIDNDFTDKKYRGPLTGEHWQLDKILSGEYKPTKADIQHLIDLYDQELLYFDHHFRKLMEHCEGLGLFNNTIIIFLSDHGEEFYDHKQVLHGYTVYEEQLRVPLIIYIPERSPEMVKGITRHVDVLQTILELLHVQEPEHLQGRSLLPQMNGKEMKQLPVVAQAQLRAVKTVKAQSISFENWKIIQHIIPERHVELYNLQQDPKELQDCAMNEKDRTQKMKNELAIFIKSLPDAQGKIVTLTPKEIEALSSLGYIEK